MSNRSSRFVHPLQSLTSALAGGPRRLPALAAVLALLVLALLPTTGQAQSDTTPPALESATVAADGATLTLAFDEVLTRTGFSFSVGLSVTADGTSVTVGSVHLNLDSSLLVESIELRELSPAITFGQDVIVTYTDPTTGDDSTDVLQDAAGNDIASFTTGSGGVPAVVNNVPAPPVALTSDPGDDYTYAIGDDIKATVTFGEAVTVTGTPQIEMQVGAARTADYASGSGSKDLVFSYTVVEGDLDADGVAVDEGFIDLNGGTILVGTVAAGLSHGAVSASTDHKVDGVRPTFVSAETNEAGTRLFVTFSEPISAFNPTAASLSGTMAITLIVIDGAVVELGPSIDFAHDSTREITFGSAAVRDLAGNVNAASSNNPITNNVPEPNAPPEFTSAASFSVAENQTAVGMVEATDEDAGDAVSYAITGGADQAKFDIDASSGVLMFKDAPDHENPTDTGGNNTYMVTVTATGGMGDRAMTDEQTITVMVTDVAEPPLAPAQPTVSAVSDSSDSLSVSWTAPDNSGKPVISSYDLQYRKGGSGDFTDGPQDVTGLTMTISGLDADSDYQVQVRATNDEGDSGWSTAGSGTTNAQAQTPPAPAITLQLDVDSNVTMGEVGEFEVSEGVGSVRIGLRAQTEGNVRPAEDFQITLDAVAATASVGEDYLWPSPTFVFPAADFVLDSGQYVLTVSNTLEVINDEIVEKVLFLELMILDPATLPSYVTVTSDTLITGQAVEIHNDDSATVRFVDIVMNEGEEFEGRLVVDSLVDFGFTVSMFILENAMYSRDDAFEKISFSVTFDELTGEATFTVTSIDNSRLELDRTFEMDLLRSGLDLAILLDEDPVPTIMILRRRRAGLGRERRSGHHRGGRRELDGDGELRRRDVRGRADDRARIRWHSGGGNRFHGRRSGRERAQLALRAHPGDGCQHRHGHHHRNGRRRGRRRRDD